MALSEVNQKILAKKQAAARFSALPAPNLGVANSTPQQTEVSTADVLGGSAKMAGTISGAFGQGVARGFASTGSLIEEAVRNPTQVSFANLQDVDPETFFGRSETAAAIGRTVFGEEKFNLVSEGDDLFKFLKIEEGTTPWKSGTFMALLTVGDLFTGGAVNGIKGAIKSLGAVDNAADAGTLLRSMGFEEDIVEQYAPIFAATRPGEETVTALEAAARLQGTSRRVETTPIRATDNAEIITVKSGKVLNDEVTRVRTELVKVLDELGEPEYTKIRDDLVSTPVPTLRQLTDAQDAVKSAGFIDDALDDSIADIRATLKTEPQRFLNEEVPETTVARTEPEVEPVEAIVVDTEALKAPGIFKPENRPAFKEAVKTQENATALREKYVSRLVDVEEEIVQQGGKEQAPTALMTERADLKAGIKAVDESIEELPVTKAEIKEPVAKLDEVANPLKEKMGMLNVNLQQRYGKAAITKSKAEKFVTNEKKVFFEVQKYLEEVAYVAENGGNMQQVIPDWVPVEFRSLTVMENVVRHLQAGTLPASHTSKEMGLYTAMVDEVARRSGVKEKPQKAVDAEGAIVESMRSQTRPLASNKPLLRGEPGSRDPAANDDILQREFSSYDEYEQAVEEWNQRKWPTKENPKWSKKDKQKQPTENSHLIFIAKLEATKVDGEAFEVKVADKKLGVKGTDVGSGRSKWWDIWQTSEKFFGKHWPMVKKEVFDRLDDAKGRMFDELFSLRREVKSEIEVKFGIKRKSKESAALQRYADGDVEGRLSYDDLVRQFGKVKANNIVEAAKWFRAKYDRHIIELNAVEKRVYPGRDDKITKPRTDYFRHMQESSGDWKRLQQIFENTSVTNLTPEGVLLKEKYASIKQTREGPKTRYDAVDGYLDYINQFTYLKHMTPESARIGDFTKALREQYGDSAQVYTKQLALFVDNLTGRANPIDRFFAEYVGNISIDVADLFNNSAKRNAILLNPASALSQILMAPFVLAKAKHHSALGSLRTVGDMIPDFVTNGLDASTGYRYRRPSDQSSFLKERFKDKLSPRFSRGFFENTADFGAWMIGIGDETVTRFAWNSFYEKAIRTGIENPVRYADAKTRTIVSGRGYGEIPVIHQSKVTQLIIPFQLEVAKSWQLLGGMMKEKDVIGLLTFGVSSMFLMDKIQDITGSDAGFDPMGAMWDSYKIMAEPTFDEEGEKDTTRDKLKKVGGRLGGEVLSNIPLGSYFAAGATKMAGMTDAEKKEFFGEEDPLRFGNAPLLYNAATENPWFRLAPPFGGRQLEKTIGGIGALARDYPVSKDGVPMDDLPVQPGVQGVLRNILFGQYSPNFEYRSSVENEMRDLYLYNEQLMEEGDIDAVKASFTELSDIAKETYRTVAKEEKAKEFERQKEGMRGTYRIVTALIEQDKEAEARAILEKFTPEEKEIYRGVHADFEQQKDDDTLTMQEDAEGIVRSAIDYSYAFVTNPIQAYNIVFKNHEVIRDTIGGSFDGVVRTRRISLDESSAIKQDLIEEQGAEGEVFLEHKVPLYLGGSNIMENLHLSTKEEHDAWTPIETYLGQAVEARKITFQEAQEMVIRAKGYSGESLSFEEIKKIVGVAEFPDQGSDEWKSMEHRGIDDYGRNTWFLGDEDKTERDGGRLSITGKIREVINN